MSEYSSQGWKTTSAANTAQVFTIDARNALLVLSINMTTSAGTATITVEGAVDSAYGTAVTIDTIAAASSTAKVYFMATGTVGAGVAVSPLSFPYIRVTVGTAGGGNTTTTMVTVK